MVKIVAAGVDGPRRRFWRESTPTLPVLTVARRSTTWRCHVNAIPNRCAISRPSPRIFTDWPDWLVSCGIRTVAMEATGVYWIPIYEILEARGIEVLLANARHVKNVPGRKSDVTDCEWLQELLALALPTR